MRINNDPTSRNFIIFDSCSGGLLGKKKVTLKVCACPSRDAAVDGFEPPRKSIYTLTLLFLPTLYGFFKDKTNLKFSHLYVVF